MQCPNCGRESPDGVKFCGGCGTRLDAAPPAPPPTTLTCAACGAEHAPGAKFCRQCGAHLDTAATSTDTQPTLPPVVDLAPPPAPPPVVEAAPPPLPVADVAPPPAPEPPAPAPTFPTAPRFEEQIPDDFSAPAAPPPAPEPPPVYAPTPAVADDADDRTVLRPVQVAVACPICGGSNSAEASQCQHCGLSFVAADPTPPAPPPAPAAPPVDPDATVIMSRGAPAQAPQAAPPAGFPAGIEPQVMDLSAIESPAPSAPPPPRPQAPARRGSSSGLLIGLGVAFALLALVAGAGAITYFKFIKPARQALETAVTSAPVASAPVADNTTPTQAAANTPAPATTANAAQAQPTTPDATAAAQAPAPAQTAATPPQAADNGTATPQQAQPTTETPVASTPVEQPATPAVDPAVQLASDRTRRGERAYANGNYEKAISYARSALNAKPGYSRAERLIRRSQDAQARIADQQMQEQAAAAARARAAAAAAAPPKPTPDEIYNQRAHDECHRGFFGKSCRHKIRDQVCQGVQPGSSGATVCSGKDN